jgi:fatty-acyl-CoA synthase
VLFTSGSTGLPKPVFRPTPTLIAWALGRVGVLGLARGAGTLMGVPLGTGQGLHNLLAALLLDGGLGLLDPLDHRAALEALGSPAFQCWRATPHFADLLSRCPLTGPAVAPRFCLLSSPISRSVHDAFLARFGVPLRQTYSCTEAGVVTVDAAPSAAVRPETVGRPVDGVEIFVGDDPGRMGSSGETGRIWVRSPALMAGYGFPPAVKPPETVDGWWPTQDVGVLEADGHLVLAGRLDDCIRTRENRLVSLATVATRVREIDGVTDVVVVPLSGPTGPSIGAVVQARPGLSAKTVRARLAETLPPWCWPRAVELVPALPRLPNGRPDRRACVYLLGGTAPT